MKILRAAFLAALVLLVVPQVVRGDEPVSKISPVTSAALEGAWKKIDGGAKTMVWQYRVSPPFPSRWPEAGADAYYVYAAGRDVQNMIADGEEVASPWARIDVAPAGEKLTLLSKKLSKIGIQGVRPLKQEEAALFRAHEEAVKEGEATYASQKEYYCAWLGVNGVIAEAIRLRHEAFFRRLACGGKR